MQSGRVNPTILEMAFSGTKKSKISIGLIMNGKAPSAWEMSVYNSLRAASATDLVVWLKSDSRSSIENLNLGAILCFARLDKIHLPKNLKLEYGLWYFTFGDGDHHTNFGYPELALSKPVQQVQLLLKLPHGDTALRSGQLKTNLRSLRAHRSTVLAQIAIWPASVLRQIAECGDVTEESEAVLSLKCSAQNMRKALSRLLWPLLRPFREIKHQSARIKRGFTYQQWNVGIVHAPITKLLDHGFKPKIEWFEQPKWPFSIADPFPLKYKNQPYVMVELYNVSKNHGEISVLELGDKMQIQRSIESLRFPYHLSYPCVVEYQGEHYCLAETLRSNELTIYSCKKFPNIWLRHSAISCEGSFADPTLFKHQGLWWVMATSFDEASGGNASLHAWYSSTLEGPWRAHAMNPIKTDVESSRSAGTPFVHEGKLYRPSQNCSKRYGGSVNINLVNKLSPWDFEEHCARELYPDDKYPDAFHHVSNFGDVTFVDGRRDCFSLKTFLAKLLLRLDKNKRAHRLFKVNAVDTPAAQVLNASIRRDAEIQDHPN